MSIATETSDWRSSTRYADAVRNIPVRETELIQFTPARQALRTQHAMGADTVISRAQSAPWTTGYLVPARGWSLILMPLRWSGDYVLNGQKTGPSEIVIAGDENGYAGTGSQRDLLGVTVRTGRLRDALSACCGRPDKVFDLQDLSVSLGRKEGRRLRLDALAALNSAQARSGDAGLRVLEPAVELMLIDAIGAYLAPVLHDGTEIRDPTRSDFDIVSRVVRQLGGNDGFPMLSDLCTWADVGQTRLYESFIAVHGISPARFLKLLRLTRAREWLADPIAPPRSVKDAALCFGFLNGGRFAAECAGLFEELPTVTLKRTMRMRRA